MDFYSPQQPTPMMPGQPPDADQRIAEYLAKMQADNESKRQQEIGIAKQLGPEGIQQQVNLGSADTRARLAERQMDDDSAELSRQLAQAGAIRGSGRGGSTTAGAIISTLGDLAATGIGAYQSSQIRDQMKASKAAGMKALEDIIREQNTGRGNYAKARYGSFGLSDFGPSGGE